jgi:hypothetical protein
VGPSAVRGSAGSLDWKRMILLAFKNDLSLRLQMESTCYQRFGTGVTALIGLIERFQWMQNDG